MTRQIQMTSGQQVNANRWDSAGIVYLLSGLLVGRGTQPSIPFYWSTRNLTAFGQEFKAYLGPPQKITRSMGYAPGDQGSFPEIKVPVRNLPFAGFVSMVAAVTDGAFRFENCTVTLRVGYLRPGQDPSTLASSDWTALLLNGFFGPPDEVTLDGLVLPLYNRGARRAQAVIWPRLPTPDTMSGGAIDIKSAGIIPPIVAGNPRGWFRVPALNLGVRGMLSNAYSGGQTVITFKVITSGSENFSGGTVGMGPYGFGDAENRTYGTDGFPAVQVHFLTPVYKVAGSSFNPLTGEFTLTLSSGLAASVPRGGYVQQFGPGINPATGKALGGLPNNLGGLLGSGNGQVGACYYWAFGASLIPSYAQSALFSNSVLEGSADYQFGWLFPDGQVRPANLTTWHLFVDRITSSGVQLFSLSGEGGRNMGDITGPFVTGSVVFMYRGDGNPSFAVSNPISAPVYYDPLVNSVTIGQQAAYTSQQTTTVLDYGTSATTDAGTAPNDAFGNPASNVIDGSDITHFEVDDNDDLHVFFGNAPAPFTNAQTIQSILHVRCYKAVNGGVIINVGGQTVIIPGPFTLATHTPTEFRFLIPTPVPFNQTVTINTRTPGTGGLADIVEVWWEHTLSAAVPSTRTQDALIASGSVPLGPVMQYADLVMRAPDGGSALTSMMVSGGTVIFQPSGQFRQTEPAPSGSNFGTSPNVSGIAAPYPTNIMVGLHALLGPVEGDISTINLDSYAAAHASFKAANIRLGFVWDERRHPRDWTELERMFCMQTRAFAFYGVSGHEILFLESASGFANFPIVQSFHLPGTPAANTFANGSQPLYARTLITELLNEFDLQWDVNMITDQLQQFIAAQNLQSINEIGLRTTGTVERFDMHTPWVGNPRYNVGAVISGIAQFCADRQAFAQTRFTFDTAWIAAQLDRGSLIRVSYPVSVKPPSFRNVVCEVESVEQNPIAGDKFTIIARSITLPQHGLDPAITWIDVFGPGDQWTTQIQGSFDPWTAYWSFQ